MPSQTCLSSSVTFVHFKYRTPFGGLGLGWPGFGLGLGNAGLGLGSRPRPRPF